MSDEFPALSRSHTTSTHHDLPGLESIARIDRDAIEMLALDLLWSPRSRSFWQLPCFGRSEGVEMIHAFAMWSLVVGAEPLLLEVTDDHVDDRYAVTLGKTRWFGALGVAAALNRPHRSQTPEGRAPGMPLAEVPVAALHMLTPAVFAEIMAPDDGFSPLAEIDVMYRRVRAFAHALDMWVSVNDLPEGRADRTTMADVLIDAANGPTLADGMFDEFILFADDGFDWHGSDDECCCEDLLVPLQAPLFRLATAVVARSPQQLPNVWPRIDLAHLGPVVDPDVVRMLLSRRAIIPNDELAERLRCGFTIDGAMAERNEWAALRAVAWNALTALLKSVCRSLEASERMDPAGFRPEPISLVDVWTWVIERSLLGDHDIPPLDIILECG